MGSIKGIGHLVNQRGKMDLINYLILIGIIVGIFVAIKFGLVYLRHLKLVEEVDMLVNWDREYLDNPLPYNDIQKRIWTKIHELGLRVRDENVVIKQKDWRITIWIKYTQTVNLGFTSFDWTFTIDKQTREDIKRPKQPKLPF